MQVKPPKRVQFQDQSYLKFSKMNGQAVTNYFQLQFICTPLDKAEINGGNSANQIMIITDINNPHISSA